MCSTYVQAGPVCAVVQPDPIAAAALKQGLQQSKHTCCSAAPVPHECSTSPLSSASMLMSTPYKAKEGAAVLGAMCKAAGNRQEAGRAAALHPHVTSNMLNTNAFETARVHLLSTCRL